MSSRSNIGFREDPYAECVRIAAKVRQRNKLTKRLDRNTYLEWNDLFDGVFWVRLHQTRILEFHANGTIVLNSGRWRTVTTKDRMNRFLPQVWSVSSDRGIWFLDRKIDGHHYIHKLTGERKEDIDYSSDEYNQYEHVYATYDEIPFDDLITIHPNGSVTGQGEDPAAQRKVGNKIKKYAREFAAAFVEGKVPAPSYGDCTWCSMVDENSRPIGEAFKDNDHFLKHMNEKYFVPSLLVRASNTVATSQFYKQMLFSWAANSKDDPVLHVSFGRIMQRDVRGVLSSYLLSQFKQSQRRTCMAPAA